MQKSPPLSTAPFRFNLPDVETAALADGTPLYVIDRADEDLVTIGFYVRSGSAHDAIPGATAFAAELMMQGTETKSADVFTEAVEGMGCTVRANADRSSVLVSGLGMADSVEYLIDLMGEAICEPSFEQRELDALRERWINELIMNQHDPDWLAAQAANRVCYSGHPYSQPGRGTVRQMKNLTRDDVIDAHARLMRSERCVIVAGPIDASKIEPILSNALSRLSSPSFNNVLPKAIISEHEACLALNAGAVQTALRIAIPCPPYNHPDFPAVQLVTTILGGYTMARLFTILREEKGYTYGAYSFNGMREHSQMTEIITSVGNEFTEDTFKIISEEVQRLATERIDDEELENARQHLLGMFARTNETPQQTASLWWTMLQHKLPEDHFPHLIERIQEFRPEDLVAAQGRYFNTDRWAIGASGLEDVVSPVLSKHASKVEVWDASEANA